MLKFPFECGFYCVYFTVARSLNCLENGIGMLHEMQVAAPARTSPSPCLHYFALVARNPAVILENCER